MKKIILALFVLLVLSTPHVQAADTTTRRRPDNAEFVTESHVRLTTESLTIAEVSDSTPSPSPNPNLWDLVRQSFSAFVQSIRDIFNNI
jgi:hypothetical protein